MPFQSHEVLLGGQADEPLASTLAYFGVNYAVLAAGLGIATLIHHRRHPAASPAEVPALPADQDPIGRPPTHRNSLAADMQPAIHETPKSTAP